MSKKQYVQHLAPTIKYDRTRVPLNHRHMTTMNVGDLCPVYVQEVLPGDTFNAYSNKFLARLTSSFLKVPMGDLFMDLNFFFVPNRLIWSKWVNLMGENTDGYWANTQSYMVPRVNMNTVASIVTPGTTFDYLGVSRKAIGIGSSRYVSQLPFRAFAKIWNDWYRNENTQAPVLYDGPGLDVVDSINDNPWSPNNIFGKVPKVSKFHDYFTSALPAPQKGDAVSIPISSTVANIPVNAGSVHANNGSSLHFAGPESGSSAVGSLFANGQGFSRVTGSDLEGTFATPDNLWANIQGVGGATVNDIRYAFALQRILEADARYGTRYTEYLQGQWGVNNPDLRLQRSEYLGGFRTPLTIAQVAQTSQGTEQSPLAGLGAFSQTFGEGSYIKSFGEDGFVIGVACIRQKHIYSQGTDRFWDRFTRFDFYNPALSRIGEQPIYTSELYDGPTVVTGNSVFAYKPAWNEYRFHPDRVSGFLRPEIAGGLAQWTFADNYATAPVYNQSFLNETPEYVDRTISIPSTSTPQFIVDFYFKVSAARLMPISDVPSLIDHVGNH